MLSASYLYLLPPQAQIISVSVVSVAPRLQFIFQGLLHLLACSGHTYAQKCHKRSKKGGKCPKFLHLPNYICICKHSSCQMVHKLCICIYLYLWHLVSVCICARNSIANNLPAQSAAVEMYLHSTLTCSLWLIDQCCFIAH